MKANKSSTETRKRLIETAIREFGTHGFDAVSTRELAKAAKVNLAAIPYHFGGKRGLYQAVLEEIIQQANCSCGRVAEKIQQHIDHGNISTTLAEELIHDLVESITRFLVGNEQNHHRSAIIIRELMTPSEGFQQLYEGYMKNVHTMITHLVAALLNEQPDSPESIYRAHALLGQIIFFSTGRELIKTRTKIQYFSKQKLQKVTEIVTETFTASIHGMRQQRGITT